MSVTSNRPGVPALFRNRAFVCYWFGRVSSTLAYQMLTVAVGWQIYALTGSVFYLGLVGLVQFAPAFLLTLVVGHVADRCDRRAVVRVCQLAEGAGAAALAAGCLTGRLDARAILAVVFVVGAARAFEHPTMQALLPNLVAAGVFPRAVARSTSSTQTANILGPALGGIVYAAGPLYAYMTIGSLYLCAFAFMSLVRAERAVREREAVALRSLFAGITFIRSRPAILGAISLDLFAVLLGGATALLPVYARNILVVGPQGLGLLRSAPSAGALLMSLLLGRYPLRRRAGRKMFAAVIVFGAATVVFGVSTSFPLSLAALVVLGAADVISVVIRHSLVQLATPDAMRGRVSAINSMFIGTSNQLGEFESGVTAAWFGVVPAVIIGGLGTVVTALAWMRLFPDLARVDNLGPGP
jgi:MFS family permease